jgi:endonuclease G, mitochondrial
LKTLRFLFFSVLLFCVFSCKKPPAVDASKPTRENNLSLGNPSQAGSRDEDNFLITRPQYTLSYNHSRSTANWVSWHLSSAWKGDAARQNNFSPDPDLPADWRVMTSDYTNSGFDRGHLCPSDDRDTDATDNAATFYLTNIFPQNPQNNQTTWRYLEEYTRKLAEQGSEIYIVAGVYGKGGENKSGESEKSIASGKITVPERIWKVLLVLPNGLDDLKRINSQTRVIAVDMPNTQLSRKWDTFRTSVDKIEAKTGLDLFSNLSLSLQNTLESRVDEEIVQ